MVESEEEAGDSHLICMTRVGEISLNGDNPAKCVSLIGQPAKMSAPLIPRINYERVIVRSRAFSNERALACARASTLRILSLTISCPCPFERRGILSVPVQRRQSSRSTILMALVDFANGRKRLDKLWTNCGLIVSLRCA